VDFAPESLAAKSQRLFALHRRGEPLRLLNAWDAGSARLFEARGAAAIGTTSAGVAFALGRPDGAIGREEMLEATARIAAAVSVPVTADVESGFGPTPAEVGQTIELVLAAGAVGVNLEDSGGERDLLPAAEAAERIAAARAAAKRASVPLHQRPHGRPLAAPR
jgi:2-methylisocitrate lyase-like PEP mutase family enzyme